jgi:hypothetical protein
MKSSDSHVQKITFLQADIEKIDKMIQAHTLANKGGDDIAAQFMVEQYEFRRRKLYRLLCIELLSLQMESSVDYFPIVQNIASLYQKSTFLPPLLLQNINVWAK